MKQTQDINYKWAEICVCLLVNFHCQYADDHKYYNLCDASTSENRQLKIKICYYKKQIDVNCMCLPYY